MTQKTKRTLWLTITPSILAICAGIYFFAFRPQPVSAAVNGSSVEIVEVEVLTKSEGIEISGNIEPANSADLAFSIAGYIDDVFVSEGDPVETGQVLAVLEDSQQRYDLAEVDVEIDTELVTGTQRNLDLLKLKREMTESSLEDTRLSSTINGIVTEVNFDVGDYVTAQAAGSADDVVVRVIDRSTMTAVVEVDELDAPYLELGQAVSFQFDAYPDLDVQGVVSFIPLEARETSQGIAVLDTEVSIPEPPDEILPYFTFAGEIALAADETILLLPEEAVNTFGTRTVVLAMMTEEDAEASRSVRQGAMGGGTGGAATGTSGSGRPSSATILPTDLNLPVGYTVMPVPVTVSDYGSGKVQVTDGLKVGDRVVIVEAEASAPATDRNDDEGGANVMELLGMPSGPGVGPGGARP